MSIDTDNTPKRSKLSESTLVTKNQYVAVQEQKKVKMRKFYRKEVEIETINGYPIKIMVWASDEKPQLKVKKEIIMHKCEVCGKEFDESRKVKQHTRKMHIDKQKIENKTQDEKNKI
ncbi:Zinc finger protein [Spraguea lophii 42_110]|uniref:Zinc finger protein n=1 Tax=Spraguea lophii (strain 42_110) TaxID=1358809 RepID=S7XV97_SPRLO|nr:Zinc finger protein [Spraguea lophii 42_110]